MTARLGIVLLWSLAWVGCYAPNYDAGRFQCAEGGGCPPDHYCASDGYCWKSGTGPVADLSPLVDAAQSLDLTLASVLDLAQADAAVDASPPDLAPQITPPASVWVSSGGGSLTATSGNQLNLSLGGTAVYGTTTATSGASITFGYFCDDTFP